VTVPADIIPANEDERMRAVQRYDILDTPPDGAFDRIAELAAELLGVPIAIVSIVDTDRIWFKSHYGLDTSQIDRDPGLCASAILHEDPWVVTDAERDPRTLANPLVAGEFGLRFYVGIPLTTHDGYNLGTLCVLDKAPRPVSDSQVGMLEKLAALVMDELELRRSALAASAQSAGRLEEVETLAQALQSSLLPPALPTIDFIDIAASFRPASPHQVGGDFYDVFPTGDTSWGFAIGDVRGKGPTAASRTSLTRYSMRTAAVYESEPQAVLRAVNQTLLTDTRDEIEPVFVTAIFAHAFRSGEDVEIHFASAGHPLPTVLRRDGAVAVVGTPGSLLGVVEEPDVSGSVVRLSPGDVLVLVTDGVHDSGGPARLEQAGLDRILRSCQGRRPQEVVDTITAAAMEHQRDDIAVMALGVPSLTRSDDGSYNEA
jgi:sigma-B regulation protein RsbU (phosphoserine phosphatase)